MSSPKNNLYEILVPTIYGDEARKPISTRHHREWDKRVLKISGGMTLKSPERGRWVNPEDQEQFHERVIPVKIMCTESQIKEIAQMTKDHYRQKAVMYYQLSDNVQFVT